MAEKISSFDYHSKTPAMVITVNHRSIAPLCFKKSNQATNNIPRNDTMTAENDPVREVEQQEEQEAGLPTMKEEEDEDDEDGPDDDDDGHTGGEKASNRKERLEQDRISARE
jgi:hypothetical protein